ncbi:VCBS repeat-containing protein [bacterium]|nr:VCBS repeat-containing protein [candidate division CSSED10-310 bacterium]
MSDTDAPDPGQDFRTDRAGHGVKPAGRGCSDGWPVNLIAPGAGFPYTPTLFDINHDGADEIFLTGGDTFGLLGNGDFLPGWPTSDHEYMGYGTNAQKPGPSVADLEGDGDVEIMWSLRDWWAGSSHMWCFNGREPDGTNMPGFPRFAPDDYSNALDVPMVLADSDGNGYLEAWTPHTLGNNFVHYRLTALDHTGQILFTRDLDPDVNIINLHFGDIEGNGSEEFFALVWDDPDLKLYAFTPLGQDLPGYPVTLWNLSGGYLPFGPPIPVDLDQNGDLEFLSGFNKTGQISEVYAFHHDGTAVTGYPRTIAASSQLLYIGLGDVTGDIEPELIALDNHYGSDYRVMVFDLATGALLWPYAVANWPHGFPCIADVDGDGLQDVCISTDGGELLAITGDGQLIPGYPKTLCSGSISGVAAGDIDGDGLFELVAATWDGWIYAWDTTGSALPGRADWPMRGIDARNTGIFIRAQSGPTNTPTETSTATPTAIPTDTPPVPPTGTPSVPPSNTPSDSPTPEPTVTATVTPSAEPSPSPTSVTGVRLEMPSEYFSHGNTCWLTAFLGNGEGVPMDDVPLFVILDIYGMFWFWDDWTQAVDYKRVELPVQGATHTIIPDFIWPDTGDQTLSGIVFWSAITDETITSILGEIGKWTFGFGPGDQAARNGSGRSVAGPPAGCVTQLFP